MGNICHLLGHIPMKAPEWLHLSPRTSPLSSNMPACSTYQRSWTCDMLLFSTWHVFSEALHTHTLQTWHHASHVSTHSPFSRGTYFISGINVTHEAHGLHIPSHLQAKKPPVLSISQDRQLYKVHDTLTPHATPASYTVSKRGKKKNTPTPPSE